MLAKKYTAILIDTSVFDRNGLKLESGLLGTLKQFKDIPTKFIVPDVIKSELKKHLEQKVKISKAALEKAIEDAGDQLFYKGSELNDAKRILIDSHEIETVAEHRLNKFLEDTGAIVINTGDYVSVSQVLEKYFGNEPPFSESGKKKNEFPDAIILMAIEAWAKENGEYVYAISHDGDWPKYSAKTDYIDHHSDLGAALASFNKESAYLDFVSRLEIAVLDNRADEFVREVEAYLEDEVASMFPNFDGDSAFYYEQDSCQLTFKTFSFDGGPFKIVDSGLNGIVIEAAVTIQYEAEGSFSLYQYDSIDKDNVFIDSVTEEVEGIFETNILITLAGTPAEMEEQLEVTAIELLSKINTIHFGYLEPYYEPEEPAY
ncbi:TPA: DUF4935 domain-containing protein [Yersinia enterocolitica]|nr:DUF4935 domain-containing protein [Yersinia enterocolitica]